VTRDRTINTDNACPTITLANGNHEGTVSVVSTSNQATDHGSMNVSEHVRMYVNVATLYRVK